MTGRHGGRLIALTALILVVAGCAASAPPAAPSVAAPTAVGVAPSAAGPSPAGVSGTGSSTPSRPVSVASTAAPASAAPAALSPVSVASPTANAGSSSAPPIPLCGGPSGCALTGGRYAWERLQPPLLMTLEPGWSVDYESPSGFDLVRADTPRSTLTVAVLDQVYATPCALAPTLLPRDADAVAAWLRSNTGLVLRSERTTSIGGHPAHVFDLTAGAPCSGRAPDVPLLVLNGELFALDPGDQVEITTVDLSGRTVTAIAAGPAPTFPAFLIRAQNAVSSLSNP